MFKAAVPFLLIIFSLAACGNGTETGSSQMDYETTKKMVVDILKTDDGKKAMQEVMKDDKVKQQLIMDQEIVKKTIEETMLSEKGEKFWKKAFKDAEFSAAVAKGMKKEHEELLKSLMKDPQYQAMVLDIMKDPEYEKTVMQLLKSKEYRSHLKKVMNEMFESPLYQAKIQEILLKAASEQTSEEKEGGGGGKSGEGGSGGGMK